MFWATTPSPHSLSWNLKTFRRLKNYTTQLWTSFHTTTKQLKSGSVQGTGSYAAQQAKKSVSSVARASLSPRRNGFNPRPVGMDFVVDKRHWDRFFCEYFSFPCQYLSTVAPSSFIQISPMLYIIYNWRRLYITRF